MPSNIFSLEDKTALITGSSRGLGLVLARGLGKAGARLILNGKDENRLTQTVEKFRKEEFDVYGYPFDITNKKQISKQISRIEDEIGSIDILVNNAGIQRRKELEDFEEAVWREIIDTNLTGAFLVSQQVVKGMIKQQSGKIINICSLQSELGREAIAPYAAAKGGLKMLTKAMTVEWAKYNIQVNGIGPGYFITDMTRSLSENKEFDQWLKNRTPAHRWGKPEELIGSVVFLASSAADYINGQIIYVDGGILAAI
jgi:gluconate 5-dehydrogenase